MNKPKRVYKQVWAGGRGVVYFRRLKDLRAWAKKIGKWFDPIGKPKLVVPPKDARVD